MPTQPPQSIPHLFARRSVTQLARPRPPFALVMDMVFLDGYEDEKAYRPVFRSTGAFGTFS